MPRTKIDLDNLQLIKSLLTNGAISRIAAKSGKSYRAVQAVLNGEYYSEKIMESAFEDLILRSSTIIEFIGNLDNPKLTSVLEDQLKVKGIKLCYQERADSPNTKQI